MSSINETTNFRDLIRRITPWWLHGFVGLRLLYAIAAQFDVLADMAVAAISLRFPLVSRPDALGPIGQERRIPRGRNEPASVYVTRLRRWLDDHATRGGPYAMLAQLHAFWAQAPFQIVLTYATGARFKMLTDGSVTRYSYGYDGLPWPRWWLYFSWPTTVHNDGFWSDLGVWSDGGVWDSDLSPADVEDIKNVPTAWNAAHCNGAVVVLSPGAELWDYPEGLWSDAGVWGSDNGNIASIPID